MEWSLLDPTSWMFVVGKMLAWMAEVFRQRWKLQNRAYLWLRLFFEILTIDSIQIVRAFVCDRFCWFEALVDVWLFLSEVVIICGVWVEFVALWEVYRSWLGLFMRISLLFIKKGSVCGTAIKWLFVRIVLLILNENIIFFNLFWAKWFSVFRSSIERNIFILILDSRYYFFSHLRFLARIVFPIWRINVVVRSIIWCFYQ